MERPSLSLNPIPLSNKWMPIRASMIVALLSIIAPAVAQSQEELNFVGWERAVRPPYAGKYESRIGGWRESENDKLRLDIGASVDLLSYSEANQEPGTMVPRLSSSSKTTFGADFFTWTRLRAAGGFKFPVEAVDYYFGLNASRHYYNALLSDIRLRVAHISAHLVDGDPSFTDPAQQYITYSREFVDAMIGFNGMWMIGDRTPDDFEFRPYAGALWLFHTIPDTLGAVTPYAGVDATWAIKEDFVPLTIKGGYEARLNTELEPIGEHHLRLGLKFGRVNSNGVTIEGSYNSGRSQYGQHFSRRERFFSLGFMIEM